MLSTGQGNDIVDISGLMVPAAEEQDAAKMHPWRHFRRWFDDAVINTGGGDDAVTLADSVFGQGLRVDLGSGNDTLTIVGDDESTPEYEEKVEVAERTILIGGRGDMDVADIADNAVLANLRMLAFEEPPPSEPDPDDPPGGRPWHRFMRGLFGWIPSLFGRR